MTTRLYATKSPDGLYGPPRETPKEAWRAAGYGAWAWYWARSGGWAVVPVAVSITELSDEKKEGADNESFWIPRRHRALGFN